MTLLSFSLVRSGRGPLIKLNKQADMCRRSLLKIALVSMVALLLGGCGEYRPIWREQTLPSGRVVKVTSCIFTWGVEHDERFPDLDSFALEYVSSMPEASDGAREQEAKEVFELIRSTSELWRCNRASVAGFPTTNRKGKYDLFVFKRASDGKWSFERFSQKVFAND
jgi:hypothetical protein